MKALLHILGPLVFEWGYVPYVKQNTILLRIYVLFAKNISQRTQASFTTVPMNVT